MNTKPKAKVRKIPNSPFYARTVSKSADGTVHMVTIVTAEGTVLGSVSKHGYRRGFIFPGWHEGLRAFDHRLRSWPTLAEAARTFATEKGL